MCDMSKVSASTSMVSTPTMAAKLCIGKDETRTLASGSYFDRERRGRRGRVRSTLRFRPNKQNGRHVQHKQDDMSVKAVVPEV